MPKILIVDDDSTKLNSIRKVVLAVDGVSEINVEVAADIATARNLVRLQQYDLLILDLQLPNREGETPIKNGGLAFVKDIMGSPSLNTPNHIVGITAYDDSLAEANKDLSEEFWAVIRYVDNSNEWKSRLARKLSYLLSVERAVGTPVDPSEYKCDLAFITAKDEAEFEAVRDLGSRGSWKPVSVSNDCASTYYATNITRNGRTLSVIAATAPEMGMPASAALTMKLIYAFKPRMLAMVGIAGGISTGLDFGDILVADTSYDSGAGKFSRKSKKTVFEPSPLQIRLDADLLAMAQKLSKNNNLLRDIKDRWRGEKPSAELKVKFGPLASASAVLASKEMPEALKEHNRKVVGIDMETYGVLHSARYCPKPRPVAVSIKSVSDFADKAKDDRYQRYAAYTSSEFALALAFEFFSQNVSATS